MKPIHEKRLRKLIAFLRQLPRKRFNFAIVRNEPPKCGAVGCAIGYLPNVFPRVFKSIPLAAGDGSLGTFTHRITFRGTDEHNFGGAAAWVSGLREIAAGDLFDPNQQRYVDKRLPILPKTATPKQVARMLEKFIQLQKEAK